jgi:hypothetical protein
MAYEEREGAMWDCERLDLPDAGFDGVARMFAMMAPFQPAPPPSSPFDWCDKRREELRRAWVEFFESNYRANGEIAYTREYLRVIGERR